MIFPINKKHTFFSKEKTLLTFFFILFISFSAFGYPANNSLLCTAFAQSLSGESYLVCCVVTIKQFNNKQQWI